MAQTYTTTQVVASSQTPVHILDLPPELIGTICDHVDQSDFTQMRLSCEAFKTHSITSFGARCFKHLIVILHPLSLGILLEISRQPDLSKFVKRVTVSGETLKRRDTDHDKLLCDLQTNMDKAGLDELILVEAFKNFHSLVRVQVGIMSSVEIPPRDGLRCGYIAMMSGEDTAYGRLMRWSTGYARVYSLVFRVMRSAGVDASIELDLSFRCDLSDQVQQFETDSASWTQDPSLRVRSSSFLTRW
jgi:hypothetical protein